MKYIVTNRQNLVIFNKVYDYIEDMIDLDEFTLIKGGLGGYEGLYELTNKDDKTFFFIIMPEYWSNETEEGKKIISESPLLRIEKDYKRELNGLFGKIWIEPMKTFVKRNFGIEIKTIDL